MPLVSVIVPVYNAAAFLEKCLESLCAQTLRDIEVLLIDDGSTDQSGRILSAWRRKDTRLSVLQSHVNQGPGAARNLGIQKAKGEYLGFVDADDWVDEDYFESMYKAAKAHQADIVLNDHVKREYQDHTEPCFTPSSPKLTDKGCMISSLTAACYASGVMYSHLYKRDLVLRNSCHCPTTYNVHEDKFFNFTASYFAKAIFAYSGPVYHYRKTNGSLTDRNDFHNAAAVPFFRDLAAFFLDRIFDPAFNLKLFSDDLYSGIQTDEALQSVKDYLKDIEPYLERSGVFVSDYDRFAMEGILSSASMKDVQNHLGPKPLIRYNTMQRIRSQRSLRCSVILPLDASAGDAEKALKSVCSQDLRDLEILCLVRSLDTGLSNLLDMMSYEDNRLRRFIFNANLEGSVKAFALEQSKTAQILFLDVNEVIQPGCLSRLLDSQKTEEVDGFLLETGDSPKMRCFCSKKFCLRQT